MRTFIIVCAVATCFIACDQEQDLSQTYIGDLNFETQKALDTFGLLSYTSIRGNVTIQDELGSIEDLKALLGLTAIEGDLAMFYCPSLTSLDGLERLQSISGTLQLHGTESLTSIDALQQLTMLSGSLLLFHTQLENLDGLAALESIGGDLSVFRCDELTDLDGLENVAAIDGNVAIRANGLLTHLQGLRHVRTRATSTIDITNNTQLSDFCGLSTIVQSLERSEYLVVDGNRFNPSFQDLMDGDCAR